MARPSEYDFEMCKEICNEVAEGKNIKEVLDSKKKYPSWNSFRRWKNERKELSSLYIRSIQDKAEMVDYEIGQIMQEVKDDKISYHIGRLLIDTLKWRAAKYYPKMFGDKLDLKVEDVTMSPEDRQKRIDELKSKLNQE